MSAVTKVTEIVTGLGMLGDRGFRDTLPVLPTEFHGVDDATWATVTDAWHDPDVTSRADDAYANGAFFLDAVDALRGRRPRLIEWTGPRHAPGDEVAPVDLRVDHVYLVSCKYLSKITVNASPSHLFDRLLTGGHGKRSGDWYEEVAPTEFAALWNAACVHLDLREPPPRPGDLDRSQRRNVAQRLRSRRWPDELAPGYEAMCHAVAVRSARRWRDALGEAPAAHETMLWRLLRIGSAPYFVLGAQRDTAPIRLRVSSPWDWRDRFECRRIDILPVSGGQPIVEWRADVGLRSGGRHEVRGHVEIRWSHGRFSGPPEAKVYLDTGFADIPGYWDLR